MIYLLSCTLILNWEIMFPNNGIAEFYLLDVYSDTLYKADLRLQQDESVRNVISDGNNICISILDERDTESFATKRIIMVDFNELKEKACQMK